MKSDVQFLTSAFSFLIYFLVVEFIWLCSALGQWHSSLMIIIRHLDEKMRDALHGYIEERGINESLFPFLQAWQYVKDHRNLMHWFKSVGKFVTQAKEGASPAS